MAATKRRDGDRPNLARSDLLDERAQALLDVINEINYFTQHKA